MKTKPSILQNPYEAQIEQSEKQLSDSSFGQHLSKEFAQKPYSETWRWSYRGTVVASYLANVFSFGTGAFAVGYLLQSQFAGLLPIAWAYIFSGILASSAALTLEGIKRNTSGNFFRAGFAQKRWRWTAASGVGLLMLLSISLTFYGASKLPKLTSPPPSLGSVEAVNSHYNNRIAEKRASVLELQTNGKRGDRLRGRAIDAIHNLELNIQALEKEQAETLATLQASNAQKIAQFESLAAANGNCLGYLSILLELIFILCFAFMKSYLWKSYLERFDLSTTDSKSIAGSSPPPSNPDNQRQPIGFKIPNIQNATSPVITDNRAQPTTTIFIKNTVSHTNKITGEIQELTERDILRFINTYTKRVKETTQRIDYGGDTLELQSELKNREQNLLYWIALLHKLHRQLAKQDGSG